MMSGYRCRLLIIALLSMQANHLNSVGSKVSRVQMRFTKEDVCKEALKTVNPVESCPSDKISIQERSRILNCKDIRDSCSSEELVFHCVSSGDKIVEVCAPRYYLDGKYCFKFDEETGRVIPDYQVFCQECPFQHYSNDSVTYTTCSKSIRSSLGFSVLMIGIAISIILGVVCISIAVGLDVGKGIPNTTKVSMKGFDKCEAKEA